MRLNRVQEWLGNVGARLDGGWERLSLSKRFATITMIILTHGMLVVGYWVAGRIEIGVVHDSGARAALYTDSLIEQHLQELATGSPISSENQQALDKLLSRQSLGKPVLGYKIWLGDTVVHSNRRELIGKSFPPDPKRTVAWSGKVAAELHHVDRETGAQGDRRGLIGKAIPRTLAWPGDGEPDLDHIEEDAPESETALKVPILEVLAPVRETGTNRIIAVAETREVSTAIANEISEAKVQSWLLVGSIALAIFALQLVVVHGGTQMIRQQREKLREQIADLSRLLAENDQLRWRANDANRRVAAANERTLKRIGADLHDGPVQLLGSARLLLDSIIHAISQTPDAMTDEIKGDVEVMRETLTDSLDEIRNLSAGLAPPEIETMSLKAMLTTVAQRHERRTGTAVACEIGELPVEIAFPLKTCIYRVAQEGLNNAFRHAGGVGQRLVASSNGKWFDLAVIDKGPGFRSTNRAGTGGGQGLQGLRDRIESLGGDMEIVTSPGGGTRLVARFDLTTAELTANGARIGGVEDPHVARAQPDYVQADHPD